MGFKYTMYNNEVYDLHTSPNIIRVTKSRTMWWKGNVVRMWDKKVAYRFWVGRSEGMRPLVRPRCKCEDNIKVDLQDVG